MLTWQNWDYSEPLKNYSAKSERRDFFPFRGNPVFQNIRTHFDKNLIRPAHYATSIQPVCPSFIFTLSAFTRKGKNI